MRRRAKFQTSKGYMHFMDAMFFHTKHSVIRCVSASPIMRNDKQVGILLEYEEISRENAQSM